jgi:hypothetical protein
MNLEKPDIGMPVKYSMLNERLQCLLLAYRCLFLPPRSIRSECFGKQTQLFAYAVTSPNTIGMDLITRSRESQGQSALAFSLHTPTGLVPSCSSP